MKKNLLVILSYLVFYLIIMFVFCDSNNIYGSIVDFLGQHFLFLDYFRELFYSNGDLFPDFTFNLGLGQNIYYIAYYGLLSPISLISFLFPFIDIIYLIQILMLIIVVGSSSLFYIYFKKHKYSTLLSYLGGFMLLGSAPLIFHSHRHIMFVSYFIFLILGLFGVDRFYNKKNSLLLIVSLVLIIFSSYYFSVGSFITLFLYGIYLYLGNKNVNFISLIKYSFRLVIPFILSILVSSVLLLPIISTLISGRSDSNTSVTLDSLFSPSLDMLYSSYNMGLTSVCFISLIIIVFLSKFREKVFALFLLLISSFPIFNYMFNGFIYINAKSLIPFIPLVIILVIKLFSTFDFKKTFNKVLYGLIILDIVICVLSVNSIDNLITKEEYNKYFTDYSDYVSKIEDNDFYRLGNNIDSIMGVNTVSDVNEYKSSLYSSTYNPIYQDNYYNTFNNPFEYRNQFISKGDNFLYSMYVGEKYFVSDYLLDTPYKLEDESSFNLYSNEDVFGLGYATNRYINSDEVGHYLNYFGNIVSDDLDTTVDLKSLEKVDLEFSSEIDFTKSFVADDNILLDVSLENDFSGKIVFINFDVGNFDNDLSISINNIYNTLTSKHWKYRNENNNFEYVLYEPDNLEIYIKEGMYDITDFEVYTYDYEKLISHMNEVDHFIVDKDKTEGDFIVGDISIETDSILTLSIPYDKNFIIKDNGKVVDYFDINSGFIGFDIEAGEHNIEIEYKSPLKNIGLTISTLSIIMVLIYLYIERKFKI